MSEATEFTADQLFDAVKVRFDFPWVLRREVTLNSRRIDVVAFGMPGSTHCRIVAIELKISRADWLREVTNFQKSEGWMNEADAFMVVTSPGVVKPGELPAGWGHLEFTGKKLMTRAHAVYRDHRGEMSRELAMRLIRAAHEESTSAISRAKWEMERTVRASVEEQFRTDEKRRMASLREDLENSKKELDGIYAAFGIHRHKWGSDTALMKAVGVACEAMESADPPTFVLNQLRDLTQRSAQRTESLRLALAQLEPAEAPHAGRE